MPVGVTMLTPRLSGGDAVAEKLGCGVGDLPLSLVLSLVLSESDRDSA